MVGTAPAEEKIALHVISKGKGLVILQDYTTERERLLDAITKYIPHAMCPAPVSCRMAPAHVTSGSDSAGASRAERMAAESVRLSLSTLADKLSLQPGRKSVFWVTQGFPVSVLNGGAAPAWNKAISALNDANIAVNTHAVKLSIIVRDTGSGRVGSPAVPLDKVTR